MSDLNFKFLILSKPVIPGLHRIPGSDSLLSINEDPTILNSPVNTSKSNGISLKNLLFVLKTLEFIIEPFSPQKLTSTNYPKIVKPIIIGENNKTKKAEIIISKTLFENL